MAGQHEQGAVAVQLQQRVAHHIARRDDVGVARDLLPHRGAVLGLRKGAGQHQFFVRVGFQIALHQIQRALFRRDAAHIQNVAPGFQPVFFANQVAGQRLAHLHRIGDEDGGTIVLLLKIVPLALRQHHQIIRILCGHPLTQLQVGAGKAAPLVHLPVQPVHGAHRVLAEQLGDHQRHRWADGVVVDHIAVPRQGVKGGQERIDHGIQRRLLKGKDAAGLHALGRVNIVPLLQAAVVHRDLIAAPDQAGCQPADHDFHTTRTGREVLVPDHCHLHTKISLSVTAFAAVLPVVAGRLLCATQL